MAPGRRWIAMVALTSPLLLPACGQAPSDERVVDEPVTVEPIAGGDIALVTLTERGAARLDLRSAPVDRAGSGMVVPSSAVLVDPDGDVWVYTNPEPLVFVRHAIVIEREAGGHAFLSEGPPPGTEVVTVGVPELYGAEFGIGH
jgi:hypothetical protein